MASRLDLNRAIPAAGIAGASCFAGLLAGISPGFALAGAFALAFALVAFTSLTAGLVVYTLVVFIEPGTLGKVLLATQLVLTAAWFARVASPSEGGEAATLLERHRTGSFIFVMFLAWAVVSTTWADNPSAALTDLSRYAINFALFVVAYTAIQTRRQAAWVVGAYLFGATVLSFVGPAIRPDFLGPTAQPGFEPAENRFIGGLADPNELAALLLPAIALALGAVAALRRAPPLRLLAVAAAIACLITFLLTASRGGMVGFAAALVVGIAVAGRWRPHVVISAAVALVSASVYFSAFAPAEIRERVWAPTQGEARLELSRLTLWDVGMRMVADQPLSGVGVGNYEQASVSYVLEPGSTFRTDAVVDELQPAHNTYLHILAELGVLGFVLLLAALSFSVGCTIAAIRAAAWRDDLAIEALARGLLAGQSGMLTAIFFFSAQSVNKVWLVLALGPAFLAIASRHNGDSEQTARSERRLGAPPA